MRIINRVKIFLLIWQIIPSTVKICLPFSSKTIIKIIHAFIFWIKFCLMAACFTLHTQHTTCIGNTSEQIICNDEFIWWISFLSVCRISTSRMQFSQIYLLFKIIQQIWLRPIHTVKRFSVRFDLSLWEIHHYAEEQYKVYHLNSQNKV